MSAAFVYFITCTEDKLLKIGHSRDPSARLQTLGRTSPHRLKLVASIPFEDIDQAREFEDMLHDRLSAYRRRGEWFTLNGRLKDLVYAAAMGHSREQFEATLNRCLDARRPCG